MKGSKKNKDGDTHPDQGKGKPCESEVLVHGAIQVHASADLIEQHVADRKEDAGQADKEYRVSKRTFWAVVIYAGLTLALVLLSAINNNTAKDAMRQSQRPWVGPYRQTPIFTGPIIIDKDGIRTIYRMSAVNFGSFGANNVDFWAQLYIAQDISTIHQKSKYACDVSTQNPDMGRVLFPGQDTAMLNGMPAFAMDIIPNKNATPPQKEYEAYLLACIGYRDQFGIPHHTETIYRSVHPDNGEAILFELTPGQSIPVEWRDWYRVVSMGQCNTLGDLYSSEFQRVNPLTSGDSNKTLPCLGLIDDSPIDQFILKRTVGSKG